MKVSIFLSRTDRGDGMGIDDGAISQKNWPAGSMTKGPTKKA